MVDVRSWSWVDFALYIKIEGCFHVISAGIVAVVLIIYMYYSSCKKAEYDNYNMTIYHALTRILTIVTLFLYFVYSIISALDCFVIDPFQPDSFLSCRWIAIIQMTLYQYTRSSLYLLIVTRLPLAFNDSAFSYSTCLIITLYSIVIIYTIAATIVNIFYIDGTWGQYFCIWEVKQFILIEMIIFDLIFGVVTLYLFTIPLVKIMRISYILNQGIPQHDEIFTNLVVRYTNLSSLCLLSTSVSLALFIIFDSIIIMVLDNIIVSISIVFMSKYYRTSYDKLCGCCHNCWLKLCRNIINISPDGQVGDIRYVELSNDNDLQ